MLLRDIKKLFHEELGTMYAKGEIDAFFYQSIEHYLNLEKFVLVLHPEFTLTKLEEQPLFETLAQLKLEKPIQYILGREFFMDMEFKVNAHVLIPRPETEELVRWILDDLDAERSRSVISTPLNNPSPKILDIGTGSGCIAIALAKHISNAKVYALDVSEEALKVAQENAENNQVDVTFLNQDILKTKFEPELKFDIIVSNPPYVTDSEKEQMKTNVKNYEPHQALFVSDDNPLQFYVAIIQHATKLLEDGGKIYLEINEGLGEQTVELLKAHNFSEIELRKDIFGKDRMVKANVPLRGL